VSKIESLLIGKERVMRRLPSVFGVFKKKKTQWGRGVGDLGGDQKGDCAKESVNQGEHVYRERAGELER